MTIEGGCLCRAVRYSSSSAPITTRICWCRVCQYIATGSGTVNVVFRREDVSVEGELNDYCIIADSGTVMHRLFCPVCGTHLISQAESRPHLIVLRGGTLDHPEILAPAATIWTSRAPCWAQIDLNLPAFEAQPPPMT